MEAYTLDFYCLPIIAITAFFVMGKPQKTIFLLLSAIDYHSKTISQEVVWLACITFSNPSLTLTLPIIVLSTLQAHNFSNDDILAL